MSQSTHQRRIGLTVLAAIALAAYATTSLVQGADKAPKYTVSEVMKAINKGEDNICKRVSQGKASKEDIAKMVEYYESLPLNKAPKGEQKSWEEKTAALVKAAKSVKAGDADGLAKFKEAVNCKACHSAHKPD
ncbi:MAG: hypothetical protein AB7O66_25270 [Limisphaerales bacterium]